ncbi:MAG: hypothetical protein LH630_05840 [Actinomycetia bacterium]|nr:hypothetical protein [Actinomycetes bacterium]
MSQTSWTGEPFAVHLGVGEPLAQRLEYDARAGGASVIRVDLAGVHDRDALAELLAQTFMFPHETRGLDAAIDLISDLEWFGNPAGYLVIVTGMDQAPEVVAPFARMLPNIVDRWRSQGGAFVVVLEGAESSGEAASALASANSALAAAGKLPWAQPGTGAVTIVDHTRESE